MRINKSGDLDHIGWLDDGFEGALRLKRLVAVANIAHIREDPGYDSIRGQGDLVDLYATLNSKSKLKLVTVFSFGNLIHVNVWFRHVNQRQTCSDVPVDVTITKRVFHVHYRTDVYFVCPIIVEVSHSTCAVRPFRRVLGVVSLD